MRGTARAAVLLVTIAASGACAVGPPRAAGSAEPARDAERAVAAALDDFHDAAAHADEARYFSHFAEGGVFLGTDASERWDVAAFRAYAHPIFARGKGWTYRATSRHVELSASGDVAWFDEALSSPTLGVPCRGSGVLLRAGDGSWKIAQYNLTIAVPNEKVADLRRLLAPASVLDLLGVTPSEESKDYVANKTQFQLHGLLTEQRHPKTMDLGERLQSGDVEGGLRELFAVDEDVAARLDDPPLAALDALAAAVEQALVAKKKIYVYGCGATGRLAKLVESAIWRPFWTRANRPEIANELVGEMTGGDRALVSSLEGFEDLQLIGRLQLEEHHVEKGDVVVAITEGGETSSVIGAILAARAITPNLFFVYNNPDERLRPFERSRAVLDDARITKIDLATGPQAITGSTRMQATTSETFAVGAALETAALRYLHRPSMPLRDRLRRFRPLLAEVAAKTPELARLVRAESDTYASGHRATYFAEPALLVGVFTDVTERSPTFRLLPLDTVGDRPRRAWFQVWTDAPDAPSAWRALLGRPFHGLDRARYESAFASGVDDPRLRAASLASLARAGDDQQQLYDFSFSARNVEGGAPGPGDLGVLVATRPTEGGAARFAALVKERGAKLETVDVATPFASVDADPFHLEEQVALKIALNACSTAIMARVGRVVGNTMTSVSPSNLKLVGRATFLIQTHVNEVLAKKDWHPPITYAEANALLFDAHDWLASRPDAAGQTAEVAFAIVRTLESLRTGKVLPREEALRLVRSPGLGAYLASLR